MCIECFAIVGRKIMELCVQEISKLWGVLLERFVLVTLTSET